MRSFLFLLLGLIAFSAGAQEIVVLDEVTKQPVFNVAIFNKDKSKSTLTDFDGKADISIFSSGETIFFRHVSHLEKRTGKRQIVRNNYTILLEPTSNTLKEVVLSVARFGQSKKNGPQKTLHLNREEILFSNPQTSADLLQNTGQVYVQKSQLGGGSPMVRGFATNRLLITVDGVRMNTAIFRSGNVQKSQLGGGSPMIRGFATNRLLITADGVRMNTAIFRSGNVQNVISIDPLSVEAVEVVMGPGSIVYGSDAIGGVMNFFTLKPQFSHADGYVVSGNAYTRYATANQEKTGHFNVSIGGAKWAFLTSASYSDFDDLKMGSHGPDDYLRQEYVVRQGGQDYIVANEDPEVQVPTGYDQWNFLQKLRYKPNQKWDFSLGVLYSTTSNFPRYDRLYRKRDGELRAAEWYYGPQRWMQTNFQVGSTGETVLYDEFKITAAYQFFEESRNDRDFREEILYHTEEQVDAYSLNWDFEKDFSENKFFYGIEYLLNSIGSRGSQINITTAETGASPSRYPDGSSWQSMGAYGSFQWKIKPDLLLQTGARYNQVKMEADFDRSFYDFPFDEANISTGALTGSAGLKWQQTTFLDWKLNFSTAFRAPNIDDVGKIFDSAPGLVVVPNPDLEPETAYNAELGFQLNFGKTFIIDIAGYYTYLDDAMVRRDFVLDGQTVMEYQGEPSRIQAIQNAASAFVYGFEAGAKLKMSDNLHFSSQLNLTEGKEEQEDGTEAPLRHAAPLFGNAHLVWQKENLKFDLFAEYNGEFSYDELAPTERDKAYMYAIDENGNPYSPEWYTLNFATQYQVSESWLATASLENITDQRYRPYSSGIAAPGRNLILALRYSF